MHISDFCLNLVEVEIQAQRATFSKNKYSSCTPKHALSKRIIYMKLFPFYKVIMYLNLWSSMHVSILVCLILLELTCCEYCLTCKELLGLQFETLLHCICMAFISLTKEGVIWRASVESLFRAMLVLMRKSSMSKKTYIRVVIHVDAKSDIVLINMDCMFHLHF